MNLPTQEDLWQQTLAWQPTFEQQYQFERLYAGIVAGNQQLNLTRITDPTDFWEKHLWDSVRGFRPWLQAEQTLANPNPKIIDIGTGGGFPGLPAAIAFPHWHITLLDSTQKKITFLQTLVSDLGLGQVKTLVGRAEQAGQDPKHRASYDLAFIRAVGGATVCAEYALPLLKVGGWAVLYRGQWTEEEEQALDLAVAPLGGAIAAIEAFTTPLTQGIRHCIYLVKQKSTPAEFPRAIGIPTQKPL